MNPSVIAFVKSHALQERCLLVGMNGGQKETSVVSRYNIPQELETPVHEVKQERKGEEAVGGACPRRFLVVDRFTSTASDMVFLARDHVQYSYRIVWCLSTLP